MTRKKEMRDMKHVRHAWCKTLVVRDNGHICLYASNDTTDQSE